MKPVSDIPTDKIFDEALRLHQGGKLRDADRLYDVILSRIPDNADALNLKGVIANETGRVDEAVALYNRAIAVMPGFANIHFNKGVALTRAGKSEDAIKAYRDAIRIISDYADPRLNLGSLLEGAGRQDEAVAAFREMTRYCPRDPRGHFNLAISLDKTLPTAGAERHQIVSEATAAFEQARALDPGNLATQIALANFLARNGDRQKAIVLLEAALAIPTKLPDQTRAETFSNLGEYLRLDERFQEAVMAQRQALALRPTDDTIRYNLAAALYDAGVSDESEALYSDLIQRSPDFVRAYVNLANIYRETDRSADAIALLEQALQIDPTARQAYSNIATTITDMGWPSIGVLIHDRAIALRSNDTGARFTRSVTVLSAGRFESGWRDYECRFESPKEKNVRRAEPPTYWAGQDLAGKNILLWTEQGIGDEVLHGSMIPEIVARAGHCVIECSGRLQPIFARSFPGATVRPWQVPHVSVTPARDSDFQISVASLGQYLRPDFASFPRHHGYLEPDRVKVASLRAAYEERAQGRPIVGISWRSASPRTGINKSARLLSLSSILQTPGTMFVNLQYGDCASELAEVRESLGVEIFHDQNVNSLADLDLFFAQVAAMDLVISTSNTTAHVAGAQNVPIWLLLPHGKGAIWYWFIQREDSPWYPSARLFRAKRRVGDQAWEIEVAARVAAAFETWIAGAKSEHV